jgi:hypothetical protein
MQKAKKFLVFYSLVAMTTLAPCAYSEKAVGGRTNVDQERSQALVMNLKTGPRSAGFFILHSARGADEMSHDLDKALSQIEAVDATYAKSRNRPDDRYLATTCLKLTAARQTAEQLHAQLSDTWDSLKSSITETLASDPNYKP